MYKILMIEDDPVIADQTCRFLRQWGYDARKARDLVNVTDEVLHINPDLILMNLYLPFKNGLDWTREIREFSKVPILFLTSAEESTSEVAALLHGADDYVTKPFELEVLAYRIQALLRGSYDFAGKTNWMEHKGVRLNTEDNMVSYQGESVELTRNEAKILKRLLEKKGKIVSREDLMEALWKTDCYIDENTLSVNITRLRRKLDCIQVHDFIQTKKGIGYMI